MPLGTCRVNALLIRDYAFENTPGVFRIEMDIPLDDQFEALRLILEDSAKKIRDSKDHAEAMGHEKDRNVKLVEILKDSTCPEGEAGSPNAIGRALIETAFPTK